MLLLPPYPHEEHEIMVIRMHCSALKVSPLDNSSGVSAADEVEWYLAMGIVISHVFIDVVQYWIGWKEKLPGHYHMAMDFLGTLATSTPLERVNSMLAGLEFTTAHQSLSTDIFIKTMCLCSWMKASIIKIPADRHKAVLVQGCTTGLTAVYWTDL
jgi:hAT family C-terminal dimerisation region